AAGTACEAQGREAFGLVEDAGSMAVYADPGKSGLDADRPALRRLLADARRGGLRRVVVRDIARLARSATLLETILGALRAVGVELLTVEGAERVVPYGYRLDPAKGLAVHEQEAIIVRKMFKGAARHA
ncbi:MAG: recombinase family protein, partial [Armatimonadota bacterium]|nr:recombinase family protein [Armatimonadota bacterium]